jgi:ElaB/YqjD/DUF883 family membrane-anchored ribosome-binding protein
LTRPDESTRENEEHLKSEVQRLLKERAVLLNETKKHNQTLQEKTSALQEQYESVIGEKNNQLEMVCVWLSMHSLLLVSFSLHARRVAL